MFLYHKWLELPVSTRHKIASEFNITKKNPTHVQDSVVINDGYVVKDIEEALNVDALQKYLRIEITDMMVLWNELVFRIENPEEIRILLTNVDKGTVVSSGEIIPKKKVTKNEKKTNKK